MLEQAKPSVATVDSRRLWVRAGYGCGLSPAPSPRPQLTLPNELPRMRLAYLLWHKSRYGFRTCLTASSELLRLVFNTAVRNFVSERVEICCLSPLQSAEN